MHLKILLPFRVFADVQNVSHAVIETSAGSYGLLPQRLDCVAALVPGIFEYETENDGVKYIAVDDGVMVKAGAEVLVSVRNAVGGVDLGKLSELVKHEFQQQDEAESNVRSVTLKLESGFIYSFDKFRNTVKMEPVKNRNNEDFFSGKIAEREKQKLRALRAKNGTVWFGLGMMGMVGWSVAVPSLLGAGLGIWLDKKYPSRQR